MNLVQLNLPKNSSLFLRNEKQISFLLYLKLNFNPLPIIRQVAAISVGMVYSELLLDLDYKEDSNADGDFNIIMDKNGDIIEIQGTGEKQSFKINDLVKIVELAYKGISQLFVAQDNAIK